MRWMFVCALLPPFTLLAQQTATSTVSAPDVSSQSAATAQLPDSPGTVTFHQSASVTTPPPPCEPGQIDADGKPRVCPPQPSRSPYQRFLNSLDPLPLSSRQKGLLAIRDVIDPSNLFTIVANAGFTVGIDSHTAYGPAWKGFGRDMGYSLVEDATGEFVSTFAIDSLLHEDPHYHRSPKASVPRRFVHAISHTVISQHDDGRRMVNYSTLLTYPISAELSNLYVPGVNGNGPSTVARVVTGLASDPIDNLITEFLPDFAKRVHIRVIFLQQLINNVAAERTTEP